ncbi:hypothetical protein PTKIN_Ptkin10aG0196800 [Pterospermum kingtungense]
MMFSQTVFARLNRANQSPLGFLKQLAGCRKGDKIWVLELYHLQEADDDDFNDVLESAIKTYQVSYDLKVTGTLNAKTVLVMSEPRCGVLDIFKGKTRMLSWKKQNHLKSNSSQFHALDPNVSGLLAQAFFTWGLASNFTFSEVQDFNSADLKISF